MVTNMLMSSYGLRNGLKWDRIRFQEGFGVAKHGGNLKRDPQQKCLRPTPREATAKPMQSIILSAPTDC